MAELFLKSKQRRRCAGDGGEEEVDSHRTIIDFDRGTVGGGWGVGPFVLRALRNA